MLMMFLHNTSWFNQASWFGPPRICQLCLNSVWLASLSASETESAAHRDKLDSDKFGDEAEDQTGGVIELLCTQLKLSITHFNVFRNMIEVLDWVTSYRNGRRSWSLRSRVQRSRDSCVMKSSVPLRGSRILTMKASMKGYLHSDS